MDRHLPGCFPATKSKIETRFVITILSSTKLPKKFHHRNQNRKPEIATFLLLFRPPWVSDEETEPTKNLLAPSATKPIKKIHYRSNFTGNHRSRNRLRRAGETGRGNFIFFDLRYYGRPFSRPTEPQEASEGGALQLGSPFNRWKLCEKQDGSSVA